MTGDDWHDDALDVLGMFVSGRPLRSPGPRGEQQVDSSFMIWLNGRRTAVQVELPENDWVHAGEVVLSTDPDLPAGPPVRAGQTLTLGGRSVVVLRQDRWTRASGPVGAVSRRRR